MALLAGAPPARADGPASGGYAVDPARAELMFQVRRLAITEATGRFTAVTGTIDPKSGRLSVLVDTRTVTGTGPGLTRLLRGPDFFNVATFPEIRFVASGVRLQPNRADMVSGALTILGVTRSASFHVALIEEEVDGASRGPVLRFSAHGTIKRSDYGMTAYLPFIGDTVKLDLEARLEREPQSPSGTRGSAPPPNG